MDCAVTRCHEERFDLTLVLEDVINHVLMEELCRVYHVDSWRWLEWFPTTGLLAVGDLARDHRLDLRHKPGAPGQKLH